MEIAEIWTFLGSQIHQDFLVDYPDLVSGLRFIFMNMSEVQQRDLLAFLLQVMEAKPTARELAEIWYASGTDICIEESEMPKFFEMLVSELRNAVAATHHR